VRKQPGLPHARHSCLQPLPVDPLMAKAKCVSYAGGTSPKAYLRNDKKHCTATMREECEKVGETARQTPRPGEEVLQALEQRFTREGSWVGIWWAAKHNLQQQTIRVEGDSSISLTPHVV